MLKINREDLPGAKSFQEYKASCGKPVPVGLGYAVSTGQLSGEQADELLRKAIKTKTPLEGYDLLMPGDPAIV